MSTLLMATATNENFVFGGIVASLVIVGVAVVWWSKRKGLRKRAEAARAEEIPEAAPEFVEAEAEAEAEPVELLPTGRTIQQGLEKTRNQGFVSRLAGLFRKEIDEELEGRMEEVLLTSDIGVKTAQKLLTSIKDVLTRTDLKDPDKVWSFMREEVKLLLSSSEGSDEEVFSDKPHVIAVVGVNGTGKTTTIGKLAALYGRGGKKVMLVAADTFRAAAVEQLGIWAERAGALFHRGQENQDPASVAFDGIKKGLEEEADIIMIDTAGRLHTQKNLVGELKKIVKVCGKAYEGAPHETILVLDATTGQNAIQQANIFRGEVGVQGIVLTKLDGTAKGGVIIGICDMLQIPVRYVGVGEKVEDLQPFNVDAFIDGLFGDS